MSNEIIDGWNKLKEYLVRTRYAIRDPKTSEPMEKTYEEVTNRITNKLKTLLTDDVILPIIPSKILSEIIKALEDRLIINATPFLMSFGNTFTKRPGFFSCFPKGKIGDSMKEIGSACTEMEQIYMRGGGAGVDISLLRPKGSPVDGGQGIAGGPVGFLPKLDAVTGTTNQGGRRRGALLVQMDWTHPDIKDFITAKSLVPKMARFIDSLPEEEKPAQNLILSNMNLCIVGNSLVLTTKGLINIKEFGTGQSINSFKEKEIELVTEKGISKTKGVFKRKKHTIKITTIHGNTIEGTKEHPILVLNKEDLSLNWKKLREISVDDFIPLHMIDNYWPKDKIKSNFVFNRPENTKRKFERYSVPKIITKDLGRLLGYLVSEGDAQLCFSALDEEIVDDYIKTIETVFPDYDRLISREILGSSGNISIRVDCYSRFIRDFIEWCGFKTPSRKQVIPWVIFQSPKEVVIEFLKSLFEGDGGVDKEGSINYGSTSKKLIEQLQIILLRLGIFSYINYKKYQLRIPSEFSSVFRKKIGFISNRKIELLNKVEFKYTYFNKLPLTYSHIKNKINMPRTVRINSSLQEKRKRKWRTNLGISYKWFTTEEGINALNSLEEVDKNLYKNIKNLLKNKYIFSKVHIIKHSKKRKIVYDIEVPKNHSFIANGIINHNSVNITEDFFKDKKLIRLIAENMWASGDPGLLFLDNMVKYSPFKEEDEPIYSNPCVVGDTLLRTPSENFKIKDLVEQGIQKLPVYCCNPKTGELAIRIGRNPRLTGKKEKVYKVTYGKGKEKKQFIGEGEIIVNATHKFLTSDLKKLTTLELKKGAELKGFKVKEIGVLSIEDYGYEDVYNITVDEFHTVAWNDLINFNCGEFLSPKDLACNLLTINVARLARITYDKVKKYHPDKYSEEFKKEFFFLIQEYAKLVCYLGNLIITLDEGYPTEAIKIKTQKFKPVGVGMSGFHTALILAFYGHVKYGEKEAIKFASEVQAHLTFGTLIASNELTNKFKTVYENKEYWNKHIIDLETCMNKSKNLTIYDKNFIHNKETKKIFHSFKTTIDKYGGFYNCITTSQAPTGSVSQFLCNLDTGIEPFYSLEVNRKVRDFDNDWMEFKLQPIELYDLFEEDKDFKKRVEEQTTMDLSMGQQLDMLEAFQKYIHTGVSRTINCPESTTVEEIEHLILECKDRRFKGLTVYREGCRGSDTILTSTKEVNTGELENERKGFTFEVKGPITTYVTINYDNQNQIRECFIQSGDTGTQVNALHATTGRLISTALRYNPNMLNPLIHTMSKIQVGDFYSCGDIRSSSLPHMISLLLEKVSKDINSTIIKEENNSSGLDLCPGCQKLSLKREGSCKTCKLCGYTTC